MKLIFLYCSWISYTFLKGISSNSIVYFLNFVCRTSIKTFSFMNLYAFYFSLIHALHRTSKVIFNKSGKSRHVRFFPNAKEIFSHY